ncbi:LuxR C-terminal-related transcriptional regulator [Actinokineospora diospyrosa]|uniref:LuxR family transcriptional regulator, maltose regulon positive regulatory protein n=1 Tax=Actinokineospora diospyrosa TaxID=103728 RepID=A0ABT1IFS1_9PSEU|nr:LuxR C-terminal-related transcriptional regulator [Actinokineospora diospyrosa]MCP2271454.1 LuxR family transcriptional regulator, maltose regulon positive regulatory protein [Actinokineospora diospyrosa]
MSEHEMTRYRADGDPAGAAPRRAVPAGKVRVPTTSASGPWRERLSAALERGVRAQGTPPPVTVVHGPAGSGKTTALAAWADAAGTPVRWATLDQRDNDPDRLWATIHAALECGEPALPPPSTDPAGELVRAVEALADPLCLVLDDVHELREPAVLRVLAALIRHTPDNLRLVIAGRTPPVHLSRLSLEGRLREIDGHQLAMTTAEVAALLAEQATGVGEEHVGALWERTRGWVAGTRLAALWLAGENRDLSGFPAEDPLATDYIAEEILGAHPPHTRQFLLSTSICERVSADLATALSGLRHAGTVLHGLARANSMVQRCEDAPGEWYRYHPLLRDHLRAELSRTRPGAPQRLHRAAARWFRDDGDLAAALEHAELAQDTELTADLIESDGIRAVTRGQGARLAAVVATLPEDRLSSPLFALTAALAALEIPDPIAAESFMARIKDADGTPWPDRIRALHETVLLRRAHLNSSRVPPQGRAKPTGDGHVDVLSRHARGASALWAGDLETAESELSRVVQTCLRDNLPWLAMRAKAHFAVAAALQSDLPEMERRARRALHLATARGWHQSWPCSVLYILLGGYAYQQGDTGEAKRMAELAVRTAPPHQEPTIALAGHSLNAFVDFEEGQDPHKVVRTAVEHWQRLAGGRVCPQVVALLLPTLVRMTLRVGEPGRAVELVDGCHAALAGRAELSVLHALMHAHHGRVSQARRLLAPVLTGTTAALATTTTIDAWLLEATLVDRSENPNRAHEALTRALQAAEPIHAVRPFLTARRSVRDMLAEGAGRFGRLDGFAVRTLAALPVNAATADPLTSRELELLLELPSMRTVDEIAESMFVSANTVKTHLRGIYRKLGVRQRRDAVVVARRQGLL